MTALTARSLKTNEDHLVTLGVEAEISHPISSAGYAVDHFGRPIILPGMAGICVNVRVGDRVFGWAADHLEAGVSAGNSEPKRHQALQFLACAGNRVVVTSGPCAGAEGIVCGKHAYVLIDFPQSALDRLAPGDRMVVRARGQGLRLVDFPEIALRSCGPELMQALPLTVENAGSLSVPVVAEIPPYLMGAGIGMSSEWANCDVMLTRPEIIERHGLGGLRIGDLVAMRDQDHRYGRGFKRDWLAIGVVAHGIGVIAGHGTGVLTIMSGPSASFALRPDPEANIRRFLNLPL